MKPRLVNRSRSRSALRRMLARSAATLGIESSSTSSRDDLLLMRGDELFDRLALLCRQSERIQAHQQQPARTNRVMETASYALRGMRG